MHVILKPFRSVFCLMKFSKIGTYHNLCLQQYFWKGLMACRLRFYTKTTQRQSEIHVPPKTVESVFSNFMDRRTSMTYSEWQTLKQDVISSSRRITPAAFDGMLMKYLMVENNYSLAKSYMDYLKAENCQPNIVTLSTYMAICGSCFNQSSEEEILDMYKNLKDSRNVLDAETIKNIIKGLCSTSYWKESIEIIQNHGYTKSLAEYNDVAWSAFRNGDSETAFHIMGTIAKLGGTPKAYIFDECINYASTLDSERSQLLMERFFNFLISNMIIISKATAEKICNFYESKNNQKWKGAFTQINRQSSCKSCNKKLKSLQLTEDEFDHLSQAVLSRVLEGSDVFLNSNPEEFNHYKNLISYSAPYDVVVDGLNVSYSNLENVSDLNSRAKQVQLVVEHFAKKRKKVLLIGRKHMWKWPSKIIRAIKDSAVCIFIDNISNDDAFLLFAALMSGNDALVVSKDLMRNHIFCLQDPHLSNLFKRWQQLHQIHFKYIDKSGTVVCQDPLQHNTVVQGSVTDSLHIPYDSGDEQNDWLCLQRLQH